MTVATLKQEGAYLNQFFTVAMNEYSSSNTRKSSELSCWVLGRYDYSLNFALQVGNAQVDHSSWGRPEDWTKNRPVYTINSNRPGSELAGETAAALASASILLKKTHRLLAAKALRHAKTLFNFAIKYK